jgi:hypothetical protein
MTEEIQDVLASCFNGTMSNSGNWSTSSISASACNPNVDGITTQPIVAFSTGGTLTRAFVIPSGLQSIEVYANVFPSCSGSCSGSTHLSSQIACVANGSPFNSGGSFSSGVNSTTVSDVLNDWQMHDMTGISTSGCSAGNQAYLRVSVTTTDNQVYFDTAPIIRLVRTLP